MRPATLKTFRLEQVRAVASGVLETAAMTFLLLVALKHFNAGPTAKAIISGSGSVGLLLSPWVVSTVARKRWKPSAAGSVIFLAGGFAFATAALIPLFPVYVICCTMAMACSAAGIPLMTQIYQENYPEESRGRYFSRTVMIRIATAAVFGELAGRLFSNHLDRFPILLLIFAGAFFIGSWCMAQCPSEPLDHGEGAHPFRALRFVRTDPLFRRTLICWMLMGLGNLMMLPLRVEYLGNAQYGLQLSVEMVAVLTVVIPNVARLVMSPIWGNLFDSMNFFVLRVVLNIGFAVGILSFFLSDSMGGLVAGAIVFGVSNAGGDVAWSLWVTKFAPPSRVADYMSVHTFFTGLRGVVAPQIAFQLARHAPLSVAAGISGALILLASLLLIREIPAGRKGRPAAALVEEVTD